MTDQEIAKQAGLTVPGVRYKRAKGWTDVDIILGEQKVEGETLADAQRRKEIALADLRELEFKEKQGTLIPLAQATAAWASLVQMTRMKVSGLPNVLCEQLAAITDPSEVRLFLIKEMDRCLTQLSNEFLESSRAAMGDGSGLDEAPDPADGDGVGGDEP